MASTSIIAEAGVNHNGSFEMAIALVDAAAEAGADYVKFQTFVADSLVTRTAIKAAYQTRESQQGDKTQYDMLKRLELGFGEFRRLQEHCSRRGIGFLSTPFDFPSIDFLATLGLDFWKIPSGEITNYPYLRAIARHRKRVVLSTGMSTMDEIQAAMTVLQDCGLPDRSFITLLHCNTQYPTPLQDVNLLAICTLRNVFQVTVGYSDHTLGIEVPVAAVALGATVVEKHFTLDTSLPGPDHKASLNPRELKSMVQAIRNVETALGSAAKAPTDSEKENLSVARKSIVAAETIRQGEPFTERNLTVKRPGTGISPMNWNALIGRQATRDYQQDDLIEQ